MTGSETEMRLAGDLRPLTKDTRITAAAAGVAGVPPCPMGGGPRPPLAEDTRCRGPRPRANPARQPYDHGVGTLLSRRIMLPLSATSKSGR